MSVAVFADVHANLPALEAVLEAIGHSGAERVVCLGDLVGYNASPAECIARVRATADVVVAGNHDLDVARSGTAAGTNAPARVVQEWTRGRLDPADLAYLGGLPGIVHDPAGFTAVHGCFLHTHTSGYVTSTMLETNLRALAARPEWPRVGLCGHTHAPMCGWLDRDVCHEPRFEDELCWPATAAAVIVNPGSVGQPRDGDPRASFALLDIGEHRARLRRVPYDVERAVADLRAADLPAVLGERLREGR